MEDKNERQEHQDYAEYMALRRQGFSGTPMRKPAPEAVAEGGAGPSQGSDKEEADDPNLDECLINNPNDISSAAQDDADLMADKPKRFKGRLGR